MRPGRGNTRPSGYGQSPSGPKGSWWKLCAEKPLVGTLFTEYLCYILYAPRALRSWSDLARACARAALQLCEYDVRCHVGNSTVDYDHKLKHHMELVEMY